MSKVSVIVTCYEYGQYIQQCVQSIQDQTYKEIELIIVDDASTGLPTTRMLSLLEEQGHEVVRLKRRVGLATAANIGIKLSTGDWVMRVDADDWLAVDCIEKMVEISNGDIIFSSYTEVGTSSIKKVRQTGIPHGSCMLYKKSLWTSLDGYDESLQHQEDADFYQRAMGRPPISSAYIEEPLWFYRRHDKQMSNAFNDKMKARQKIIGGPKILTVIPARGNSKEVPGKNLKTICGKTLVELAIDMVKESGIVTQLYVSTEDAGISGVTRQAHTDVIDRPSYLSEDHVSAISVTVHALQWARKSGFDPDIVITVQPTCPFTPPESLSEGVRMLVDNPGLYDSVVSAAEVGKHPSRCYTMIEGDILNFYYPKSVDEKNLQRQDRSKAYGFTGGFYIRKVKLLETWKNADFAVGRCAGVKVSQIEGIDIDTKDDLLIAQLIGESKCT